MGIKGLVTLTTIALGLFIGSQLVVQQSNFSTKTSADTRYIRYLPNNDIKIELKDPHAAQNWDYGLEGDLCFNQTPPSANGKFRVELVMKLKDNNDSSKTIDEVIGASVTQLITNPFTLDCNSARLRRGAFTAVMNIPEKDRWVESCPEILVKVTTTGPWNKIPKPEVATIDRSFLCPNGAPTTAPSSTPAPTNQPAATATPSPQPTSPQATSTPAPTARPQAAITGNIAVFSCNKAEKVQLTFCDEQKTKCNDLPFTSGPSTHGVWLDDNVEDRTYRYKYSISQDPFGKDLEQNKKYYIDKAFAFMGSGGKTITSLKLDKNIVETGQDRDLTVHAVDTTCECTFRSLSQVYKKNADGSVSITNDLNSTGGADFYFGTSNDRSILRLPNPNNSPDYKGKPSGRFANGSIEVTSNFASPEKPFPYSGSYGKDGKAYVRLYAPGYNVVGQVCKSAGETHSCPGESFLWEKNFPAAAETNNDFKDLRVTCGTDITYGWIIEKQAGSSNPPPQQTQPTQVPTQTPRPTQPPQATQPPARRDDSGSECGESGCNTFGLIMWDSDRKSDSADHHMCWAVASNGGKKNLKEKSDAGEWNCLNSNADYSNGKVTKLKTTYKNLTSGTARIGWQLSRCKDDKSNCTQNPNSPDGDRLEEASDLMCVPPGQDVTCEWEVAYMKPTRMSCNRSKCASGLQALQQYNLTLSDVDINNDGSINAADLIVCIDEWGTSEKGLKCDFTRNGTVDALDYSIITTQYGKNVKE